MKFSPDKAWDGHHLTPRRWQKEALMAVVDALSTPKRPKPCVVHAVMGSGKSVVIAELCCISSLQPTVDRIIVTTPTIQLVDQLHETVANRIGPAHVGRFYTHAKDVGTPVIIACMDSLPTLAEELRELGLRCSLWAGDECFPAGTLIETPIGPVDISELEEGMEVVSYDEDAAEFVDRTVTHVFRRLVGELVKIRFDDKSELICTPNHPLLTQSGWRAAKDIKISTRIARRKEGSLDEKNKALPQLRNLREADTLDVLLVLQGNASGYEARNLGLLQLRSTCQDQFQKIGPTKMARSGFLLDPVHKGSCARGTRQATCGLQPQVCLGSDESQESNAQTRDPGKGFTKTKGYWSPAQDQGRERKRSNDSGAETFSGTGLACERGREDQTASRERFPSLLQDRHWRQRTQDRDRGRRTFAQLPQEEAARSKEREALSWLRVDSVEILQQTGNGQFGGLCPDGLVYNIEVEGTHTYVANGIVVHNCHRSESRAFHEAIELLNPDRAVGFTATPFLAESGRSLSLFEDCVYSYGIEKALADDVVVPWKIVPWGGSEVSVDKACLKMIGDVMGEGPGIVNAVNISDAEAYAKVLSERGISAEAIHSKLPIKERRRLIGALEEEELSCLVHVNLFKEGVDFPWLRWMCLRRPVTSRVRFAQEVGRSLRSSEGKELTYLLDPHDLFGAFQLSYEAVLGGEAIFIENAEREPVDRAAQLLLQLPVSALQEKDSTALSRVGRYLRQCSAVIEASGRGERIAVGSWRSEPITVKQLEYIQKTAPALKKVWGMPTEHRKSLGLCYRARTMLSKGQASDFLTVLFGLAKKPRQWPELAKLMTDEGVGEVELPKLAGGNGWINLFPEEGELPEMPALPGVELFAEEI